MRRLTLFFASLACVGGMGGCNAFSFLDSPSGDAQLLSAARACFDNGDYECASKYYNKVSGSSNDELQSEKAYLELAQNGMGVSPFIDAVVTHAESTGKMVTQLANNMGSSTGVTTRLNIFHAYQKALTINDKRSRGLVRFITSLALVSEILAEAAITPGDLKRSDLAKNPTSCITATAGDILVYCDAPTVSKLSNAGGTVSLETATDSRVGISTPDTDLLNAAVTELEKGLTEMESKGSLGTSSLSFAQALGGAANAAAFRKTLLTFDVGAK